MSRNQNCSTCCPPHDVRSLFTVHSNRPWGQIDEGIPVQRTLFQSTVTYLGSSLPIYWSEVRTSWSWNPAKTDFGSSHPKVYVPEHIDWGIPGQHTHVDCWDILRLTAAAGMETRTYRFRDSMRQRILTLSSDQRQVDGQIDSGTSWKRIVK